MEQYAKYLRKSRFDRDYAELSVEETLKRHEAILDKLAKERGYHIAKTYHEVVSGESIAARPMVRKLLAEVNAGLYAGVLVVDLERLARGNSADQAYISQVFQFSETKIITPAKVYDPGNEFDEEYFEFGLFMSRREYKTINRRLIRGRESSAAEGKYLGSVPPYGYRRVKLKNEKGYTLEPDPVEGPVVQRIFELFLQREGTRKIANALNDASIPTRHGEKWTYATISNILTNPVYMGKIKRGYCKQIRSVENGQAVKRVKHLKNMADYTVFDGLHPALIDEETFGRAQEIRAGKQPAVRVKDSHALQNAFAGLMYCACCGKRVARTTLAASQKGRVRVRCVNMRACHNATADYALVEQAIIDALRQWLEGYRVKIETVGFAEEIARGRAQMEKLEQDIQRIQAQLENAYDLVEQGLYTPEFFRERREKLTAALSETEGRKAALGKSVEELEQREASRCSLIPHTEALLESYGDMTAAERNRLLKVILRRIEYRKGPDGKIVIDLFPQLPRFEPENRGQGSASSK
ncbi:MAG: recombinase family protein [Clostridia bacterium]|nr:recombinase family protein [Clostridia bacterium]MBR0227936.1 recombinase family protein [Clostridia bacterium]